LEALWIARPDKTLPWLAAEIAQMALDTEQLQIFGWNKKAHKYMKNGHLVQVMQALFQQIQ
jgi:hypothetical protein